MYTTRCILVAAFTTCLLVAAGCTKSEFDFAPVTGRITVDGKPFTAGRIMFAPIAADGGNKAGKPAFGTLGTDGNYRLETSGYGEGAVVADHWVTLLEATPPAPHKPFTRMLVPKKQSVLADQANVVDIDISATDLAKMARRD